MRCAALDLRGGGRGEESNLDLTWLHSPRPHPYDTASNRLPGSHGRLPPLCIWSTEPQPSALWLDDPPPPGSG